jgi:16S rRNA (guanine966-N2)-methyltransferase
MRVIAGRYKGRRLHAPPGQGTRPTSDRVREALFSILGARVQGARVLDLFAGSGALAIEALSRGALEADLVEREPRALEALRRNAQGVEGAQVVRGEARAYLRSASQNGRQYDLVFLDPPYRHAPALGRELAATLVGVLAPDATVVSESDRRAPLDLPPLTVHDERRYGDTLIRLHAA